MDPRNRKIPIIQNVQRQCNKWENINSFRSIPGKAFDVVVQSNRRCNKFQYKVLQFVQKRKTIPLKKDKSIVKLGKAIGSIYLKEDGCRLRYQFNSWHNFDGYWWDVSVNWIDSVLHNQGKKMKNITLIVLCVI